MAFYIKKSVKPIEARELTIKNQAELMDWCGGMRGLDGGIRLKTPESDGQTQVCNTGSFIAKVYSEELGWHFYPIHHSYMSENYEEIKK